MDGHRHQIFGDDFSFLFFFFRFLIFSDEERSCRLTEEGVVGRACPRGLGSEEWMNEGMNGCLACR